MESLILEDNDQRTEVDKRKKTIEKRMKMFESETAGARAEGEILEIERVFYFMYIRYLERELQTEGPHRMYKVRVTN